MNSHFPNTNYVINVKSNEPHHEKYVFGGVQPGKTQTSLLTLKACLEAWLGVYVKFMLDAQRKKKKFSKYGYDFSANFPHDLADYGQLLSLKEHL